MLFSVMLSNRRVCANDAITAFNWLWKWLLANVNVTFAICCRPSVCRLSVCRLSVTFVRRTQAVQIFGNISTALGTLAVR